MCWAASSSPCSDADESWDFFTAGRSSTGSLASRPLLPVGYQFDGTHLYVAGFDPRPHRKYRNVAAGHHPVTIVSDDLVSTNPWTPR